MKKKRRLKGSVKALIFLVIILVAALAFIKLFNNSDNGKKTSKNNGNNTNSGQKNNQGKKEEEPSKRIRLAMVGDVLIHESVYLDAKKKDGSYDFMPMFEYIPDLIKGYDLKYFNQESTIGGKSLGITAYPSFNSPDEIGDNLVELGFNMVSLANNHAYDRGQTAIDYSIDYWKKKNIIMAGSYENTEEQNNVPIYEKNGIKFAFLSYTTFSNNTPSNSYSINIYNDIKAKQDVEKAKEQGADLIIVAMHWGTEYTNDETQSQTRIAEYLSSLGVNVIIGAHPHVVEPIKYVGDTLVIYSLGNFISNQLVLGVNQGTGLFVGVDIVLNDDGSISFENLNYELLLQYSDNSTNFKVIPYSKLNNDLLKNYETYKELYETVVERYMKI